jgi:hypothetical protein
MRIRMLASLLYAVAAIGGDRETELSPHLFLSTGRDITAIEFP